jgi:hypothetical protein
LKRKHLAAIVAALALAVASCGGDDSADKPAPEAGTSPAGQAEQPDGSTPATPQDSSSTKAKNGDGGSSAAEAKRAAGADQDATPATGKRGEDRPKPAPKAKTPAQQLATLPPAKRQALHKDLYEQGKTLCYAYGPEELAKSANILSSDPEEIARQYARAYEKATPELALPYQQGCLAGFKRRERNPPNN